MAKYSRVREQHIAVFGESGSGKTVLASSFYGPSQEKSLANQSWDLVADDTSQGNRLYKNYVGMRDHATTPPPTRFKATVYSFSVKIKGDVKAAKSRPFDVLRLVWHDYPGEWFEESPSSAEEAVRRVTTFRALMRSDVALLLVDAQKLLDYKGEEERYLKSLFTNFRQGLLHLKDDVLAGEGRLADFPRIWVVALSKADLVAEGDVQTFRDLVIWKAEEHIAHLRETLQEFVIAPDALSLGEDFMLLSSAKFELAAGGADPVEIDVTKRVGVDLILPVASLLPLERRLQWQEKMKLPMQVVDTMADGADSIAKVLVGGRVAALEKAVSRIPGVGSVASKFVAPALNSAVRMAASELKELNAAARANHDHLTATVTQFKLDLEKGVVDGRFIRAK